MVDITLIRKIVGWMAEWYGFIRGACLDRGQERGAMSLQCGMGHGSWVSMSILGFHSQVEPDLIIFTQLSPNQIKAFPKGQEGKTTDQVAKPISLVELSLQAVR